MDALRVPSASSRAAPTNFRYTGRRCRRGMRRARSWMWHPRYFADNKKWKTMDDQLRRFGKLNQPVRRSLGLIVAVPGTTFLTGGNEVHSGPPSARSRMFAYAIGIPTREVGGCDDGDDASDDVGGSAMSGKDGDGDGDENDENDGEVQYSPVLLHIDFCCILFGIFDFENHESDGVVCNEYIDDDISACRKTKVFLVDVLINLIEDYPMTVSERSTTHVQRVWLYSTIVPAPNSRSKRL